MKIRAIIFGASGMVGRGVLLECLESDAVSSITMVNRRGLDVKHPKLKEIIHSDFLNFKSIESEFRDLNACFWTLGISAVGLKEEAYTRITFDYTMAAAKLLRDLNPGMTFCYVSGAGTNAVGRSMWARVKGRTENELMNLGFEVAYMFRPGFIQPMKGVKSRTAWYNALYRVFKPLYPVLKFISSSSVTTTVGVGRAMINCVVMHPQGKILSPADINRIAEGEA